MNVVVACCVWGNWPETRKNHPNKRRGGDAALQGEYIRRLANGVARNLAIPHRFICFADDVAKVPGGIEAKPLSLPWFGRAMPKAYVYGAPFTGCPIPDGTAILVLDLDDVIVGDLSPLLDHGRDLVVREQVENPRPHVPDGDVVFTVAGSVKAKRCADIFAQETRTRGASTQGGDDRPLLARAGAVAWSRVRPGMVLSYRVHCRKSLPDKARVVCFHGTPLPDQAQSAWVKEHWR